MSKNITSDLIKNTDNKNTKAIIIEQPTKPIIKECSKKELPIIPIKTQTDFNWFPLMIFIAEPALNASNPQIHSDSKAQQDWCLGCACFICFLPALVIDTISCPCRLCFNKLF